MTTTPQAASHGSRTPDAGFLKILRLARAAAEEEGDRQDANMDWTDEHQELVWAIWSEIDRKMAAAKATYATRAKVFWDHVAYNFDDLPDWLADRRP